MTSLRFLTIDLFLYDLQDSLAASVETVDEVRERFWQRIYEDTIATKLPTLKAAENTFASSIELLGAQRIENFPHPHDGYYYPVKLGDTYGLQIDYSGKKNNPDREKLAVADQVKLLKEYILNCKRNIPATLGQNWFIFAQLTNQQPPEQIATKLYEALQTVPNPNWQRDRKGQGSFKGATWFELEQSDTTPDKVNQNHHVLICLFPPTAEKADIEQIIAQLYRDLMPLFLYRNKVLWTYEQSRQLKIQLKEISQTITAIGRALHAQIQAATIDLNRLQVFLTDSLSVSNKYETFLGYLQEQTTTIEINTNNYMNRVQSLKDRDPNGDQTFLDRFSSFANLRLAQVKTDSLAFNAGLKPLETFIKTVQGITEIEKAKNERNFNHTVAIATVGVSTATLAASTLTSQADAIVKTILPVPVNQPTPPINTWMNVALPLLLSIAIGLLSAGFTWILLPHPRKRVLGRSGTVNALKHSQFTSNSVLKQGK